MTDIDRENYAERAAAERKIASDSADANIAALHSELASLYDRFLGMPRKPELRIVAEQGERRTG